jgi:hypothetical protein
MGQAMIDASEHARFVFNTLQHVNSDRKLTPAPRSVFFWLTHRLDRGEPAAQQYLSGPARWPSIERLVLLTGLKCCGALS